MDAKTELLHQSFNNMSYGENIEDTTEGTKWLESTEITDHSHNIEQLLKNLKVNTNKIERHHLIELAHELQIKSSTIAQVEILTRGVLSKDTRKSVDILIKYLNYYAIYTKRKDDKTKSKGINVAVLDDNSPLWILGFVLAPSLAAGYTIILQTGVKFSGVLTYILELARKVGISDEWLTLVPSNDIELEPYLSNEQVSIITLFVDLLNPNCRGINKFNKKILVLSSYKTPFIIFDDADLDSAVENVITAAWGYQGTLPWSTDTIIIQENIFKRVTEKLKNKVQLIKIGLGNDKNADVSYPTDRSVCENLSCYVEKAKSLGIEVYQKNNENDSFTPTLIIGSKASTNSVIHAPKNNGALTLIPFRFIDEAVDLANNSRQGLGVSVWAEKVGLVNEVARKLKANNVWINSHGLFSPEVPLTPYKGSGVGCFGSALGFAEYTENLLTNQQNSFQLPDSFKTVESVKNAIKIAKAALNSWWKKSLLEKTLIFEEILNCIEDYQQNKNLPNEWLNNIRQTLENGINNVPQFGTFAINGFNIMSIKEPKGVIVIEMRKNIDHHNFKILTSALLEGNAVIILNEVSETETFFNKISKLLPSGVLSVLPYSLDAVKTCSLNEQLNGYFSNERNIIFSSIPLSESKIFSLTSDEWQDSFRKVTLVKNIWSNIGESFQCNL